MATQLLCHRTYLLHLSALSSLRNLCRSRHRLKQTTGPLYLDQNPCENQDFGRIWLFLDIWSVCEVGWWIYVSIDRRPLPGRSGEDREGQHLTRISDGEWAPPEKQILTTNLTQFLQKNLTNSWGAPGKQSFTNSYNLIQPNQPLSIQHLSYRINFWDSLLTKNVRVSKIESVTERVLDCWYLSNG